jgi:hypothetical protein
MEIQYREPIPSSAHFLYSDSARKVLAPSIFSAVSIIGWLPLDMVWPWLSSVWTDRLGKQDFA